MCGIAGIIRREGLVEPKEIQAVTHSLSSRGPDEYGIWTNQNMALGHRRLSIIDLDNGKQPMFSFEDKYGIVFNGEIYNYREIRKDLESKGYEFTTSSDTEVLLYSYIEWEEHCLDRLRGMFAFGIIDRKKRIFFIARDHMGIKPLVYYQSGNIFAFASELQALKNIKDAHFTLDVNAIDQYLWLQYIPAPQTAFNEIKKLKPAHYLKVDFQGEILEMTKYWEIDFSPASCFEKSNWQNALDDVLRNSVKAHLVADVPVGALLSGGIDSSLIVKYISEISDKQLETFSIGFKESQFDESHYAKQISNKYNTKHHEMTVDADSIEILPDLVKHYGEPFGDSSAIPTYFVSQLARKHVPVVLSGDGADEIFAGYESYILWMKYLSGTSGIAKWKKLLRPIFSKINPQRYPARIKHGNGIYNWLFIVNYMPLNCRYNLWKEDYWDNVSQKAEVFEEQLEQVRNYSDVNKAQYWDIKTYLPYDILPKVDTASMMHGLEVRTPYVDKEVYEFASKIPVDCLFKSSGNKQYQGKILLKDILRQDMPSGFVERKKMGFALPIDYWLNKKGCWFQDTMQELVCSNSRIKNYFNAKEISRIIRKKHFKQIWLLIFLEEWLKSNNF